MFVKERQIQRESERGSNMLWLLLQREADGNYDRLHDHPLGQHPGHLYQTLLQSEFFIIAY